MTPPQERAEHVGTLGACLCFQSRDFFSTFVSFKRDVFCVFATGALLNPVHGGIYLTMANHTSGQNENNFASLPSPAANFFLTDFFPSPATHDWLNERGYEASHKNTHSQVFCLSFCAFRKEDQKKNKLGTKEKQSQKKTEQIMDETVHLLSYVACFIRISKFKSPEHCKSWRENKRKQHTKLWQCFLTTV